MTDFSLLSDAHKDAYGYRPSGDTYRHWASLPPAELELVEDELYAAVERAIEDERVARAAAVAAFEAEVTALCGSLNIDRATALRWLVQAEGCEQDGGLDYFAYLRGLPRNYFDEVK